MKRHNHPLYVVQEIGWEGYYLEDIRSEIICIHLKGQSHNICSAGNKGRGKRSQK